MQEERVLTESERQRIIDEIAEIEDDHPEIRGKAINGKIVPVKATKKVKLVNLNDIKKEDVAWLYEPYIPKGKLTLCGAYPGTGKTYLMCKLAAAVSTGESWMDSPKESPFSSNPGKVIYLTAEDGIGDTIKARVEICGANDKNIYTVEEGTALTLDDPQIEDMVKEVKPELLVIDPIQAYIGPNINMNSANETRSILSPIIKIAKDYNVAIVIICHFNKNMKGDAITRILGSTDIVGSCRSYIALGNVPDQQDIKYMSHEKSSLAKKGKTILFEIDPEQGGIHIVGQSDLSADDYAAMARKNNKRSSPALDEAKDFIIRNMPDGKRNAKEMLELMKANGFSEGTIRNANAALGVKSQRVGFGKESYSIWVLPCQSSNVDSM